MQRAGPAAGRDNGRLKVTRALAPESSGKVPADTGPAQHRRMRPAVSAGASPPDHVEARSNFLSVVTASGATVGAAATLPGIGTLAAWFAAAGEVVVFLGPQLFVLALASAT